MASEIDEKVDPCRKNENDPEKYKCDCRKQK